MYNRKHLRRLAVIGLMAAAASRAKAQEDSIELPTLVSAPEVPYPADTDIEAIGEARVVLELTIDPEGQVADAQVRTGVSPELDQLALANAPALRFTPARRNGQPVTSRVLYEFRFVAPKVEASPTTPPIAPPPGQSDALEVVVRGASVAEELRRSAYAVEVLELAQQRQQTADLGEVLARGTSVIVRRAGGLGSAGRYTLGGMSGNRVRFFLDGVPLELSGFPLGVGNVPVNLIDRIEVYQGVVPIQFGADALGGAVQLVSDENVQRNYVGASYQGGSFDTHRLTLTGGYHHEPTGFFIRGGAYLDSSANDYLVHVEVPDELGRLSPATARRFHDRYHAYGATLSLGVVDKPWADRFYVRGFFTILDRDVQNNVVMTVPYGEVTYDRQTTGGLMRYRKHFSNTGYLEWTAGYAYNGIGFHDVGTCRYNWFGQCVAQLPTGGEITGIPIDANVVENTAYLRSLGAWTPNKKNALRLSFAPTFTRRTGHDDQIPADVYDPLRAKRGLDSAVVGAEYATHAWGDRLVNIAFVKGYWQALSYTDQPPNGQAQHERSTFVRGGGGDSFRLSVHDEIYLKGAYEYATRLPTPMEAFGDGGMIVTNLDLIPELSHNVNFGVYIDAWSGSFGTFRASVEGIARFADHLIVLLRSVNFAQYANVATARALGVNSTAGYTIPSDHFGVESRLTYQDVRNTSASGPYAMFRGDRVPNLPFLETSGSAFVRTPPLAAVDDFLELTWNVRYVHDFFLGWESAGPKDIKLTIPSQLVQSLALTYAVRGEHVSVSTTAEVQNLTNARIYDFYGVQRPGRAFFFKLVVSRNQKTQKENLGAQGETYETTQN